MIFYKDWMIMYKFTRESFLTSNWKSPSLEDMIPLVERFDYMNNTDLWLGVNCLDIRISSEWAQTWLRRHLVCISVDIHVIFTTVFSITNDHLLIRRYRWWCCPCSSCCHLALAFGTIRLTWLTALIHKNISRFSLGVKLKEQSIWTH